MDLASITIALAVFIGLWYALASALGRRAGRRAVSGCGGECAVRKSLATATSYFAELECPWAKYVGVFVQRLPWDNPLNLAASLLAGRRPLAVVKAEPLEGLGWRFDMSRFGSIGAADAVVGRFHVVGKSLPRGLVEELARLGESLGVGRIIVGGEPALQLFVPTTDCRRALYMAQIIINKLYEYRKH